jgi:hypothetical protein
MKIIKEDLTGCINRIAPGAPEARYWVIEEPINETGICKEFKTEAEAQEFMREQRRENNAKPKEPGQRPRATRNI